MAASKLPSQPDNSASRYTDLGVCLLLGLLAFLVFSRTLGCGFVFDDSLYVSKNPIVQKGLTWDNLGWAFTHIYASNWHPLTWLSHMLDCQLYGLNPMGHHLTNLLLHTVTVILLFLVLRQMTGALWRSAFVAAVFAVHPLHVESVAWVAERKDMLSGLFFMVAIGAYVHYVRRPWSPARYGLVVLLFALGLMCKPMLVTLPLVLLLLDYWPLKRFRAGTENGPVFRVAGQFIPKPVIFEKLPLMGLTVASCVITIFAQTNAIQPLENFSLPVRLGNAAISYVAYIGQMFWPSRLAVVYPLMPKDVTGENVTAALIVLMAISAGAVILRHRPYFLTGWFWYLIMLVPVIGIVQVGMQARADRYTYLPQIGLYLAVAWAVNEFTSSWRYQRQILATAACAIILALSVCTWKQISYWRTDEVLWEHALACTSDNYVAHNNLGFDLARQGRNAQAVPHFQKALEINPDFSEADNNLGTAFLNQGRLDEAAECYRRALELDPDFAEAQNNLGILLAKQGQITEAIEHYRRAIELSPARAEFYYNLGNLLATRSQPDEAIVQLQKALKIDPDYAKANNDLADILFARRQWQGAAEHYQQVLKQTPDSVHAHYQLGLAFQCLGKSTAAIAQFQKVLELDPDHVTAQNNLAWILATCPDASLRNGPKAVAWAQSAVQLSAGISPQILDTLAAAYAEAGRFAEAVATARRALDLSSAQNNKALTEEIQNQLKLFENHSAYHEKPPR